MLSISIQDLLNEEETLDCSATRTDEDFIESLIMTHNCTTALDGSPASEMAQEADNDDGVGSHDVQLVAVARVKEF